jgi:uncharacterized phage protein (TIGR01671 family)
MRDIKFRAWNLDTKKWNIVGQYNLLKGSIVPNYNQALMQFTGLKDAQGKEIYEGDIIFNGAENKRIVIYEAPSFFLAKSLKDKIDVDAFSTPHTDEEVIGNIYENPELLKQP